LPYNELIIFNFFDMEYNEQSSQSPLTFALADPFQRLAAAFIDGLLIGAIHWVCFIVLGWSGGGLGIVIGIGYSLTKDALPFLNGKSLGKTLIGIRVVTEKENLPITGNYAVSAIRVVPLMIPVFNIIDALMVFSTGRQRFGDKWAGTVVIMSKE